MYFDKGLLKYVQIKQYVNSNNNFIDMEKMSIIEERSK